MTLQYSKLVKATYAAALVSFLFGIIRDYSILNYSSSCLEYYNLFYVGGLCSIIAVNMVILDSQTPTIRLWFLYTILSLSLLVIGWFCRPNLYHDSLVNLAIAGFVATLWILGAIASRAQITKGFAFTARLRDGIFSVAITLLMILGVSLIPAFAFSVLASTLWILWITRDRWNEFFIKNPRQHVWLSFLTKAILLNLGTLAMLLWALYFNSSEKFWWGYSSTAIVRISMYAFQAISIGWVVASTHMPNLPMGYRRYSLSLTVALVTFGILVSWISLGAGFIVMPIAVGSAQYFAIIYLHNKISLEIQI